MGTVKEGFQGGILGASHETTLDEPAEPVSLGQREGPTSGSSQCPRTGVKDSSTHPGGHPCTAGKLLLVLHLTQDLLPLVSGLSLGVGVNQKPVVLLRNTFGEFLPLIRFQRVVGEVVHEVRLAEHVGQASDAGLLIPRSFHHILEGDVLLLLRGSLGSSRSPVLRPHVGVEVVYLPSCGYNLFSHYLAFRFPE